MKKILFIVLMLLTILRVSAQGGWTTTNYKADELKGMEAYTAYQYNYPGIGSFVTWDWDFPSIRLVSDKGIFSESIYNRGWGNFRAVRVLVGIYQSDGTMTEKFFIDMNIEKNSTSTRIYGNNYNCLKKDQKRILKVLKALRTKGLYVRFVCDRYNESDFDLSVPSYQPLY